MIYLSEQASLIAKQSLFFNEEQDAGYLLKKVDKEKTLENIKHTVKTSEAVKKSLKSGNKFATSITPEIKQYAKTARITQKLVTVGVNTADVMKLGNYVIIVFYGYRGLFKMGNIIMVDKNGKVAGSPMVKIS